MSYYKNRKNTVQLEDRKKKKSHALGKNHHALIQSQKVKLLFSWHFCPLRWDNTTIVLSQSSFYTLYECLLHIYLIAVYITTFFHQNSECTYWFKCPGHSINNFICSHPTASPPQPPQPLTVECQDQVYFVHLQNLGSGCWKIAKLFFLSQYVFTSLPSFLALY